MAGRTFKVAWQDTAEDLFVLYRAERDRWLARRWQALWLLRRGKTLAEAADAVGAAYRTVQEWVGWYRVGGPAEVARHRRGGLRRVIHEPLTPEQLRALEERSRTVGFATMKQAMAWVAETFGVRLTIDQMRRVFAMLQLRRKVPRPVSERADAAAQEAWKRGA